MSLTLWVDRQGQTRLVGRLYQAAQSQAVSFEYDAGYLAWEGAFAVDPTALPLGPGGLHAAKLFGALQDCGPDRWGRLLIDRAVRKGLLVAKPYSDLDYVLALDDATRQGALRFQGQVDGPFLATGGGKVPPLVRLRALLNAADAIQNESETAEDLRFLLGAGSPLGGARPKAAVRLEDGELALAKFSKPDDSRDIAAGEVLALTLARRAGLKVADHALVAMEDRHLSVITRFDRLGDQRLPFISAATLLGLEPGEEGSYVQMAEGLRRFGDQVPADLAELWARLAFGLLISNQDDHLRNHGFLMERQGRWALSPAYDLNPVPETERARYGKTPVSEDAADGGLEGVLQAAPRFGLTLKAAQTRLTELVGVVAGWRQTGKVLGLKAGTLEDYASAFEHGTMAEAKKLLGGKGAP